MLTARIKYGDGKEFLDILKILHNLKYCHERFCGKITLFFEKACLLLTETNANDWVFFSKANKMNSDSFKLSVLIIVGIKVNILYVNVFKTEKEIFTPPTMSIH